MRHKNNSQPGFIFQKKIYPSYSGLQPGTVLYLAKKRVRWVYTESILSYRSIQRQDARLMRLSWLKGALAILLILFSLGHPLPASAQSFYLRVYPPITNIIIRSGKGTTIPIKITNTGNPLVVTTKLVPFVPSDEIGGIRTIDCERVALALCQVTKWFTLLSGLKLNEGFFLEKNASKDIKMQLFIPKNTPSGDYTFTLLFSSHQAAEGTRTNAEIIGTIGTNIIVTVTETGEIPRNGQIVAFSPLGGLPIELGSLRMHLYDSFDQIPVILKIQNTGPTLIEPGGEIRLTSPVFPLAHYTIPIQYVLGHTIRLLLTGGSSASLPGPTYTLLLPRSLYLGKYTLETSITLVPNGPPVTVKSVFLAFPFKAMLLVLAIILAAVVGRKKFRPWVKRLPNKKPAAKSHLA